MSKTCPRCGFINEDKLNFCSSCGLFIIGKNGNKKDLYDDNIAPIELSIQDYSISTDLNMAKAIDNIPIVSTAAELLISLWQKPVERAQLLGNGVRLSPEQIPSIYNIAKEAANLLNINVPEIFIKYDPTYNAYTLGTNDEHIIVIHSSIINDFTEEELRFIIGHEMGHIKSRHVTYSTIAYSIANSISVFIKPAFIPLKVALDGWQREAEKTADRVGYLTTLSLTTSLQCLLMFALGSRKLVSQLNLKKYLEQENELNNFYGTFSRMFGQDPIHPFLVNRVSGLINFSYSDVGIKLYNQLSRKYKINSYENQNKVTNELQYRNTTDKQKNKTFCKNCGFEVNNTDDKNCEICGSKIRRDKN